MTGTTGGIRGPQLKQDLLTSGILRESSVPGLYQRSATFESVLRGIEGLVRAAGVEAGGTEPLFYLPPVMPRETFMRTDYLRSFPDMIGSVETFQGGDAEHAQLLRTADEGGDWTRLLTPSEVTLCSAACHPLYPFLTGTLPEGGRRLEVQGFCFRHEPSPDPARMQVFRQHEFVYVGTPAGAIEHRDTWLERGLDLLSSLGLPVEKVVANDPFFGRAGRMLAKNQREHDAQVRDRLPGHVRGEPDRDHLGQLPPRPLRGALRDPSAPTARWRTRACIGFGLERVTLALFSHPRHRPGRLAGPGVASGCGREHARSRAHHLGAPPALRRRLHAAPAARRRPGLEPDQLLDRRLGRGAARPRPRPAGLRGVRGGHGLRGRPVAASTSTRPEDLRTTYGIDVHEMNPWQGVLTHIEEQLLRAG